MTKGTTAKQSNIQDQAKSKYTRYHTANRTVCPGWQQARRLRLEGWTQEKLWRAPRGRIGGRRHNRGRSNTFTLRLAFIKTFAHAFRDAHRGTLVETFGWAEMWGWPVGERFCLVFELMPCAHEAQTVITTCCL